MIVTVENGLDHMKQYLDSVGKYEVYYESEYNGPIDALIYTKEKESEHFDAFQEELRIQNLAIINNTEHGLIIINAKHKSPHEIEMILDSRLYQNIF